MRFGLTFFLLPLALSAQINAKAPLNLHASVNVNGLPTATVTVLCSNGSTCSVGTAVAVGSCVVGVVGNGFTTAESYSWSDTKSNSYSLAVQDQVGSGTNIDVNIYYSVITTALTTSDSISETPAHVYAAVSINPCTGLDITTSNTYTPVCSPTCTGLSIGPSASTNHADLCIAGFSNTYSTAPTWTPESGWTSQLSLNNGSNKAWFYESDQIASGNAVTATSVPSTSIGSTYPGVLACFVI